MPKGMISGNIVLLRIAHLKRYDVILRLINKMPQLALISSLCYTSLGGGVAKYSIVIWKSSTLTYYSVMLKWDKIQKQSLPWQQQKQQCILSTVSSKALSSVTIWKRGYFTQITQQSTDIINMTGVSNTQKTPNNILLNVIFTCRHFFNHLIAAHNLSSKPSWLCPLYAQPTV